MLKHIVEFWLVTTQARNAFTALEAPPNADAAFAPRSFNDLQSYTPLMAAKIVAQKRGAHVPTSSSSMRFLHSIGHSQ